MSCVSGVSLVAVSPDRCLPFILILGVHAVGEVIAIRMTPILRFTLARPLVTLEDVLDLLRQNFPLKRYELCLQAS